MAERIREALRQRRGALIGRIEGKKARMLRSWCRRCPQGETWEVPPEEVKKYLRLVRWARWLRKGEKHGKA